MAAIERVRVGLVQCPVWGVQDPPLGLAQIAGCVTHCNQEARAVDFNARLWRAAIEERRFWSWDCLPFWNDPAWAANLVEKTEPEWDRCVAELLGFEPHIVGFSVALGSRWTTLELARRIKRGDPRVQVVLGGPYLSSPARAEELIAEAAVDAVVIGSGEDIFPKMLGLFRATGRWVPLPGMMIKGAGGVVRGGRPVPYTFDLDVSPALDFSGLAWEHYERPEQLPISASRGCPFTCTYCGSREFWLRHSFKSGDRIFGDVVRAMESNPAGRRLVFYDIMANGRVSSLVRFADMMRDLLPPRRRPTWSVNAAPTPEMTRPLLDRLRGGGCTEIVYGVESASSSVLSAMGRPAAWAEPEAALRETHEAGIRCVASFLAGFPGETEEDFGLTVAFLRRARPWLDAVCVAPVAVEETSLLGRRPERFGSGAADGSARARRLREEAAALGLAIDGRQFAIGEPVAAPAAA